MFSIIICTYNGERTLGAVIEKILLQQDYDKYVEQLIIVDNASVDATESIIREYESKPSSKITYSYEKNSGLGNARLNGVRLAQSEWTVFVDDDNELDSNWIIEAAEYIKAHSDVAIFGCSVIPKLEFEVLPDERERLTKYHGMLACTDLTREDIDFSKAKSPFGDIIGAGMTVKTEYLKELASNGWINQMGRTKDNTAAGDDGEISRFVTDSKGKKAGYCPSMIIEHNLPKERLQEEYLLKLRVSLTEGCYKGQSSRKLYILRRIKQIFKMVTTKNPFEKGTFEYKMLEQSNKTYWKLLIKDKFILR